MSVEESCEKKGESNRGRKRATGRERKREREVEEGGRREGALKIKHSTGQRCVLRTHRSQ